MKLTLLALGSRGDVQPLLALALGLRAAGHNVCVATHGIFAPLLSGLGLGFAPVQSNPKELLESASGQAARSTGSNPLSSLRHFAAAINAAIVESGAECLAACRGADVILYGGAAWHVGPLIAEALHLPVIGTYLQPFHRTRAYPGYASPTARNLGGLLNELTFVLDETMFWLPVRSAVNRLREQVLGLPPIPRRVNSNRHWQQHEFVLYGFSPAVVPGLQGLGDRVRVTGYWFLDRPATWQPPAELVAFLQAGPPPVYVGFGSMGRQVDAPILEALARCGQRGLIGAGWSRAGQGDLPESVFEVADVPHDWLFPQMAAVVRHGGAGTTAAGLRAGVPSVIVPFMVDQPFWGQRVADLGAGPEPIPQGRLTAERLAAAIGRAVGDAGMRRRAREVSERIRAEDGVARAVQAVDDFLTG